MCRWELSTGTRTLFVSTDETWQQMRSLEKITLRKLAAGLEVRCGLFADKPGSQAPTDVKPQGSPRYKGESVLPMVRGPRRSSSNLLPSSQSRDRRPWKQKTRKAVASCARECSPSPSPKAELSRGAEVPHTTHSSEEGQE